MSRSRNYLSYSCSRFIQLSEQILRPLSPRLIPLRHAILLLLQSGQVYEKSDLPAAKSEIKKTISSHETPCLFIELLA
jgi:hypothetical protein